MKKLIKLLTVGVLLLHGSMLFAQKKLKVLSYNIEYGMRADTTKGKQQFVNWVKEQDPDIVALEEANKFTPKTLQELAESYGHKYSVLVKETGFPVALTSKYPIENAEKINEGITHGFIAAQTKDLNIVVLHLNPHHYDIRRAEIKIILDKISQKFGKKELLVMGDFNSFTPLEKENFEDGIAISNMKKSAQRNPKLKINNLINGEEIDFEVQQAVLDFGLIDIIHDLAAENPADAKKINPNKHRIDYIYCSKDLRSKVISGNFIKDGFTKTHSDHLPIIIELKK